MGFWGILLARTWGGNSLQCMAVWPARLGWAKHIQRYIESNWQIRLQHVWEPPRPYGLVLPASACFTMNCAAAIMGSAYSARLINHPGFLNNKQTRIRLLGQFEELPGDLLVFRSTSPRIFRVTAWRRIMWRRIAVGRRVVPMWRGVACEHHGDHRPICATHEQCSKTLSFTPGWLRTGFPVLGLWSLPICL